MGVRCSLDRQKLEKYKAWAARTHRLYSTTNLRGGRPTPESVKEYGKYKPYRGTLGGEKCTEGE